MTNDAQARPGIPAEQRAGEPSEHPTAPLPDKLFSDPAAEQRWRQRFAAIRVSLPDPARDQQDRAVYVSNATGTFELSCWDIGTGKRQQATDRPDGTTLGGLSADGSWLWWFDDTDGDEFGSWQAQPFGAAPGQAIAALPDVPPGYPAGLEVGRSVVLAGFCDDDGTRIHRLWNGQTEVVYTHPTDGGVGALSTDESIWVLEHSEHGDSRYQALRAMSVSNGTVFAELDDTPGKGLSALAFSPIAGDQRLLVGHERNGRDELGIWNPISGEMTELSIDLPGDLTGDFYPDASALLLVHTHAGRATAHRYSLADGTLSELPAARGVISGALARPDGAIWYRHSSAAQTWELRALSPAGADISLLPAPNPSTPGSEPVVDVWVDGVGGRIHALLSRPPSARSVAEPGLPNQALPTVFLLHGGPAGADEDSFDPARAAYLDAGIAVCQVNYRGSTGYGSAWRDALTARIGHTELADVAAVHDHLVTAGLVDVGASAVVGHSWGGFLALLALGTQPSRWRAGVAGVPVADYVRAYRDEMEPMRAYDRALFGGSPDQVPSRYQDSSPLTYVDAVSAPVLVTAGENDPRCPIRQIENYLDALAARGKNYNVYRFQAGHGSMVVDERIRQVACEVAFVRDALTR